MIRAKKGKLILNGQPMELINEYRVITKAMVEMLESEGLRKEQIKEKLLEIVNVQFMTEEEKQEKFAELLYKIFSKEEKEGADNE